jgi:hypothetical protein
MKIFAEMLQKCIKTAHFCIREDGILLCTMDSKGHILIDSVLEKDQFLIYKYTSDINIGINVLHFYNTLKAIKKKDIVKLVMYNLNKLFVKYIPKDGGREVISELHINPVQSVEFISPTGYKHDPIIVYSDQFQKMCKELSSLSKNIIVMATKYSIKFKVDTIYPVCQEFSVYDEYDYIDEGVSKIDKERIIYTATFSSNVLTKFMKISKFHTSLRIYVQHDLPILFKIPVDNLGYVRVYMKSNELIKSEEDMEDTEEDNYIDM